MQSFVCWFILLFFHFFCISFQKRKKLKKKIEQQWLLWLQSQKVYRPVFRNLLSYGRKIYMLYGAAKHIILFGPKRYKPLSIADYRLQVCKYHESISSIACVDDGNVAKWMCLGCSIFAKNVFGYLLFVILLSSSLKFG